MDLKLTKVKIMIIEVYEYYSNNSLKRFKSLKMLNSDKVSIENIVNQTRSSEKKFKQGNFKGAIEDKRAVRTLLNSKYCHKDIIKKFKEELSFLYSSKFDLINDHKLRIDETKIREIIKLLEQKSDEKYHKGDFKGAIRALRRSEKYLAN